MRRRVLVAEDNEEILEILSENLEQAGYECLRACDGIEALRLFREACPDAIVLDLHLPGLHGLEVLREVKEIRPGVVVVVVTGQGTEQTAIRALKLGADDYLRKPVRGSVLRAALQERLDRTEREQRASVKSAAWARVSEERLANVWLETPTPLLYADAQGTILATNRAAIRLLGQVPDLLSGQRVDEFVEPSLRHSWFDTVVKEVAEGRSYEAEIFLRAGDAQAIAVSAKAVAETESGGCLIFSFRDLTRQRALEAHYFEAKKLASLGRVVEGVAHEVRNPLVSVGGFTRKLLEEFAGDERARRYLEVILSDVHRLEHMVQEIEEYVAFLNRRPPGFAPVHLGSVLSSALARVTARFPSTPVAVQATSAEVLPTVFGDEALLGDLFEGLIENAFEAMPSGGTLTVSCEAEGKWARLRLSDTGIGISEEDLAEIFNPFVTAKTSGAGLGLAKAHIIVEEHAGTIEFDSALGKGTVVSVSLPIDRRRLRREES